MGRKKASERNDDYLHRIIYIEQRNPLRIDVIDKKGRNIPNFTNITIKKENQQEQIEEIIEVVKKTIKENNTHKNKNLESINFNLTINSDDSDDFENGNQFDNTIFEQNHYL